MNRYDEIQAMARDIASNIHADSEKRNAMADDLIRLCSLMIREELDAAARRQEVVARQTAKTCQCPHPADEHSVYGCADDCACEWMPQRGAARQAAGQQDAVVATLATPCDTCDHTLNWHDNQTGCILDRCACGRFREPSQPDEAGEQPTCAHCGKDVENRGDPSMDGNHHVLWIHVPGGHSICFPQQKDSPRATPAAGQPDTQQQTEDRRRLAAVERLCSGRPGYHTVTVKELLTAMSEAAR